MFARPSKSAESDSPVVIVGIACRVPGADSVTEFAELLFNGRTGYGQLPPDRCDRDLYFDAQKGKTGKSYTTLGGIVPERPLNRDVCPLPPQTESLFDAAHVQFAEVAATAWRNATLQPEDSRLQRTGVYVGHSGGTKSGGGLSLGTQIEEALSFVDDIDAFRQLPENVRRQIVSEVAHTIREVRPSRHLNAVPSFHAYQAAALAARVLGLTGTRSVIDAACASSLVALSQAILAIRAGRLDSAIVGGATYNNVDNLILFSHSQACTATDSRPFDDGASGLVSSEGYVAIVITTQEKAEQYSLPILGVVRGVGMASDGKGRSLWAPRMEGQVLALQRAYGDAAVLDIDYMEAHATSTQLGDATELETLRYLVDRSPAFPDGRLPQRRLLLGSVKSNIGHTLEAAGLIGVVKVLLAMHRRQIPASLRFEHPNHNYDWSTAPVTVVATGAAWPDVALERRPRRAAVSAFGIGGLNAHVVIEEHRGQMAPVLNQVADTKEQPHAPEPIAIVGRGIVVAGARNLNEFRAVLSSPDSAISDAPPERWRNGVGIVSGESPVTYSSPHCRGGFINDFTFDGARYRIPPKQVQQANPVQMMLIDAVAQALAEMTKSVALTSETASSTAQKSSAREPVWPVDRQRVGVVIGTIFGGEFGDQLQVGMRLPEICQRMMASMLAKGITSDLASRTTEEFRKIILKNRPALLDETGSFTASTLASRVAKTFDLMGGAAALDSDDTSGLAALTVAMDQLRAETCDMVVCGSAQRSMSLSAFEALDMTGRLVRSGSPDDVPDDCHQILPGEGVVALMLCRLSDAVRLGLPIYGVVNDVGQRAARVPGGASSSSGERRETIQTLNAADAAIVRKIGYLAGAHSLVRITSETLSSNVESFAPDSKDHSTIPVATKTVDGVVIQADLKVSLRQKVLPPLAIMPKINSSTPPQNLSTLQVTRIMMNPVATPQGLPFSVRFGGTSGAELLRLMKEAVQSPNRFLELSEVSRNSSPSNAGHSSPGFNEHDIFRAVILASDAGQLKDRLNAAIKSAESGRFRVVLDRERVILWQTFSEATRVAWLFPGQGSHYTETPAVFAVNEHARRTLAAIDDLYVSNHLPRLSDAFGNSSIRPGEDVWWAQAWILGVTAALTEALKAEGHRPDAVLGHSFGEFTASLASNVTSLSQTVELAKHRANAVMSHMRTPGGLLSVRAAVHEVDAILKSAALPAYVTHLNSSRQTVIAGSREGISSAKALLDRQGLASMSIPVPAPFHTPLLADAEIAFERMSASVSMRPPVCGFLSATSVQYLAEPSGIRQSLVRQLTQPVMYLPSIQRMLGEGFRVFLEVGPNDVLTRMNRDIVDSQALCLSLDIPGQSYIERMAMVNAVLECVTGNANKPQGNHSVSRSVVPTQIVVADSTSSAAVGSSGAVIDVTKSRRGVRKPVQKETPEVAVSQVTQPSRSDQPVVPQHLTLSGVDPVVVPGHAAATTPAFSDAQLRAFVRDLVIELTGYAPEIIDFEADLEADLGVDSIKKAQILGELGEWMGLTVRPESLRLDSVRTLDDAVRVAQKLAAESNLQQVIPAAVVSSVQSSVQPVEVHAPAISAPVPTSRSLLPSSDRLDALLIDYVVDQTGYSRDIVDIDADLEADLGLDSIKLAQLIGEMREQFNLESLTLESIAQARFRTLRGIREFLITHAGSSEGGPDPSGSNSMAAAPAEPPVVKNPDISSGNRQEFSTLAGPSPSLNPVAARPSGVAVVSATSQVRGVAPVSALSSDWSPWLVPADSRGKSTETAHATGVLVGQKYQPEVRAALRSMVYGQSVPVPERAWSTSEAAHLKGIAEAAGVSDSSVRLAASLVLEQDHMTNRLTTIPADEHLRRPVTSDRENSQSVAPKDNSAQKTNRYTLRVVSAPRRKDMPRTPELKGAVLILGSNDLADTIADRVQQLGQKVFVLNTDGPIEQIERTLTELWQHTPTPHLFLTMAFDKRSTQSLSELDWKSRRSAALTSPFRICQLWMQKTIDANRMEDASVVSVTQLGGDFGFSGRNVRSIEAIGGLVKAMLIECWMRGFRTTPMKVVDVASGMSMSEVAAGVLQELAVPSYDMEIAFRSSTVTPQEPERLSVQAIAAPLKETEFGQKRQITRGGTWIISGGGRGITAVIATTLAKKYDLRLHMLGTAPAPQLSDDFVRMVASDRGGVRRSIMQEASSRGENPVEAWRNTEKAIEIDATLRECRRQNVEATYHCCDVSDFSDVEVTIRRIREQFGPINGVIHGAGAGQDARFDRKRPDKVEKCLQAKIDGSLALMHATQTDPLECFVAFGSISGRFGANGHTDYSLANDMMAKIVDRYRSERPEVRSFTFHWHAWGDIGMATKPEAKLALEMIDMEFMPAREGIEHFMREVEFGGSEAEVLITDESYFRKFFPAERLSLTGDAGETLPVPLIPTSFTEHANGICSSVVTLNPITDRFLSQHRVQGRPTLPFVVALELMAEAVRIRTGCSNPGVCLEARALQAIRFSTDDPLAITVQTRPGESGTIECRLLADVRRRDGRMVEEDREFFRAIFDISRGSQQLTENAAFRRPHDPAWKRIEYVDPDGLIYHGPELQELREVADDGETIFGRIASSAPVQLFGGSRARGFTVPCSTMDACLYAVGYAAWHRHQKPSLPVRFDQIEFGRLPDPGEPCLVRIQQTGLSESGAVWNFQLQGHNGDRLLTVTGYRIGWLKTS
jgi:acyl transferase domain-containing protein/NAD(P)-dependent dehydrogenase (short-subunit alcohol dehydrogenase family)/aryl carrier-like protein